MSSDKLSGSRGGSSAGKGGADSSIDSTVVQRIRPKPVAPPAQSPDAKPSGQIKHDSRGNAIWNWAKEALESTSRLLKRLEVPELKVEDKPKGLELEEREPGGGYDPYNRRNSKGR